MDTPTLTQASPASAASATPAQPQGGVVLAALSKRYGDGPNAVDNIDLRIEPGTYCCLLGPSGCGKTTMLRMIAGHETPSDGAVLIDGQNVVGRSPRERGTAMMFQNYALFPHLSVRDNVAFSLRVRGLDKAHRLREADRVVEQVQLTALAGRLPGELSGGQQQRVAIARAIVTEPAVVLADEPTGNLDTQRSHEIMGLLMALNVEKGITVLMVTHEPDMAAYARRMVHFIDGRIAHDAVNAHPTTAAPVGLGVAETV